MDLASFKKSQEISGVVRGLGEGGNLRAFFNTLPRDCCMNARPHGKVKSVTFLPLLKKPRFQTANFTEEE